MPRYLFSLTNDAPTPAMTDYEKLEYIHFAILEALDSLGQHGQHQDPELTQALAFVEDLREPYLS